MKARTETIFYNELESKHTFGFNCFRIVLYINFSLPIGLWFLSKRSVSFAHDTELCLALDTVDSQVFVNGLAGDVTEMFYT